MSFLSTFYSKVVSPFWGGSPTNYENDIGIDSRDVNTYVSGMVRNNSFYAATSRAYRRGVSGTGFNMQSKTGITYIVGKVTVSHDKVFEKYFKKWSRKTSDRNNRSNCDFRGMLYFDKAVRIMVDEYAVKRGGFIVRHRNSVKFKYGYKFEIITLDMIDTSKHNEFDNLFNGLQLDSKRNITHIWIFFGTISKKISYDTLTLSVNQWSDANQYSGVSPIAPILETLEYIDTFKASEQDGAKRIADNPLIIKSPRLRQMAIALQAEKAKIDGTKFNGTFESVDPEIAKEVYSLSRLDNKKDLNDFAYISDDEDIWEAGAKRDSIYDAMYHNEIKMASSGVGLSAYSTSGILPPSYNAALMGLQYEEDEYKIIGQEIIEDVLREMVEVRLQNGLVLKGLLSPPNYWSDPEEYREVKFLRKERTHIDPAKQSKATTEDMVNNKTKTMTEALAEKNIDVDTYLDERFAYEEKLLEREIQLKKSYKTAGIKYPQGEDDEI